MTTLARSVTGGVDTHLDVHVVAALHEKGTLLGVEAFETTRLGYKKLLSWRRRKDKSDSEDAISAARAAFSGDACGAAKTQGGNVEAIRVIRIARLSARRSRTLALNQMRSLVSTAPEPIRDELRRLSVQRLLERAASYRPGTRRDVVSLTKLTLRTLARRAIDLEEEVKTYDALMGPLVAETAPALVAVLGIGTRTDFVLKPPLLTSVGLRRSMPRAASRNGTASTEAETVKPTRALWHIVITRMVYDPRTIAYIERRMKEGLAKKEAFRCLKRYIAREVYGLLPMERLTA